MPRVGDPKNPYDALPYTDHAYAESHPDRLAVVARLAGWSPPPVARARVLELGCGRGGNLLPMAASLAEATLVGVDLSTRQIDAAREVAAAAGLANVTFVEAGFESPVAGGPFDYVVAHGVCSWVAPEVRRALLRAMAATLGAGGVAYVSFNVLPGWYERMAARDWLRGAPAKDARASLAWLRAQVSPALADYRRRLEAVAARLAETERAYLVHEYLAPEHHPLRVEDLLGEAADAGLAYLGDAIPSETALELLPDAVRERARGLGAAEVQRLVDFVRNTAFRRALFVRADEAAARGWRWSPELAAPALNELRVASRLAPRAPAAAASAGVEEFEGGGVTVQVAHAGARAALRELERIAPRSLPMTELVHRALAGADLPGELFDLWLATGAVDLHAHEPAIADGTSERPVACPVARWHARHGGPLTNRWHQEVRLDDAPLRAVLALLDGTRTVESAASAAGCTVDVARASIAALAAAALLEA
jgi:SAM-dependent methyltransferase